MRHRALRRSRPPLVRRAALGTGRAVARLSGLLVLSLVLLAAAGVAVVVRDQTSPAVRVTAATTERTGPAAGHHRAAAGTGDDRAHRRPGTRSGAAAGTERAAGGQKGGTTDADGTAAQATDAGGAEKGDRTDAGAQGDHAGAPKGRAADGQTGHVRPGDHRRENRQAPTAPNPNCTLMVPAHPTGAAGLATLYRLAATEEDDGPCHEADADQSAFVEAAIIQPTTGRIWIYHPLVVDEGARPAAAPVPVTLPPDAVVGVWFGFNGDTLTLGGPGARECVNGLPGSPFGQFAYCNAPAFFQAAQQAIAAHRLTVPDLGTGADGLPCPTTRDFSVVDQDQSDNLATTYRIVDGRIGQDTAVNRGGKPLSNGSDEGLLAKAIDKALGCTPFTAPDLTDPGSAGPALALNELSAAAHQAAVGPEALVPLSDPMVKVDDAASREKANLYRAGVDQPPLPTGQDPQTYCRTVRSVTEKRLALDAGLFAAAPSPTPDADDLLDFLKTRLENTLGILECQELWHG